MSQLLEYTKKINKKSREKIEKLFLVQNFLKRKMSQFLDNTKKMTKNREKNSKNYFWPRIIASFSIAPKNDKKSRKKRENYFWLRMVCTE